MWNKIRWDKYNRFKKVKSYVALNNLHIRSKNLIRYKMILKVVNTIYFLIIAQNVKEN